MCLNLKYTKLNKLSIQINKNEIKCINRFPIIVKIDKFTYGE